MTSENDDKESWYTGCTIKNNPLGKIYNLSYCKRFFLPSLQLSQRSIHATYAADFITVFAMV